MGGVVGVWDASSAFGRVVALVLLSFSVRVQSISIWSLGQRK